jgi:hypothetical protein
MLNSPTMTSESKSPIQPEVTSPLPSQSDDGSVTSISSSSSDHSLLHDVVKLRSSVNSNAPSDDAAVSILKHIHKTIEDKKIKRKGKIYFKVKKRLPQSSSLELTTSLKRSGIIRYIVSENNSLTKPVYYYSSTKYNPHNGFKVDGFKELVLDIQRTSVRAHRLNLTQTGTTKRKGNPNGCFRISCSRCQIYRGNKSVREQLGFVDISCLNKKRIKETKMKNII